MLGQHKEITGKKDQLERFLQYSLIEAKREMAGMREPDTLLNVYLLTAMGTLGFAQGFVFSIEWKTLQAKFFHRGMEEFEIRPIRKSVPDVLERYFFHNVRGENPLSYEITVVPIEQIRADPYCPPSIRTLMRWFSDTGNSGLIGLGERLGSASMNDPEIRFLHDLTSNLMFALEQARHADRLRRMEDTLSQKEAAINSARKSSNHAWELLNRKIFHLNCLQDLSRELSNLKNTEQVMKTFLMTIIGTLSLKGGYVTLIDREKKAGRMIIRSINSEKLIELDSKEINNILQELSESGHFHNFPSMSSRLVTDRFLSKHPLNALRTEVNLLFTIEGPCIGVVGIGKRLNKKPFTESDLELITALVRILIGALESTLSFQTIRQLNTALSEQNTELSETLKDLKSSRYRIEVLEKAKERILSLVRGKTVRSNRASIADIIIMLFLGLILGLVFNIANPGGVEVISSIGSRPAIQTISMMPSRSRIEKGSAVLVDARPGEFFDQKHIPSAINLPLPLFDFVYMMHFTNLDPNKDIIVYGRNISRLYDEAVAAKLINRGHSNVYILEGGLPGWEKNGYPIEKVRKK